MILEGKVDLLRGHVEPQLGLQPQLEVLGQQQPRGRQPRRDRHEAGHGDPDQSGVSITTLPQPISGPHSPVPGLGAEQGLGLPEHGAHRGLLHTRAVELGHHHPQHHLLVPE